MIYLDSALIEEAQAVVKIGWVKGITTNPTLLNKSINESNLSPEESLKQLAVVSPGELYYQLCADDFDGMVAEAKIAAAIIGEKIVLKIPATPLGFQVTAHLSPTIACSVTAIYSPAQAIIAAEAGAKYAIAYVNRATRLLGDGLTLVREMSNVLKGSNTEILAASLKSPEEAAATVQAGAHHLTLPMSILQAMTTHELSEQTVDEFLAKGTGITITMQGIK
jgi:transaldolase